MDDLCVINNNAQLLHLYVYDSLVILAEHTIIFYVKYCLVGR